MPFILFIWFYIFITSNSFVLANMWCLYVQIFLFQTNALIIFCFMKNNKVKRKWSHIHTKSKGYHIMQVCGLHSGAFWCSGGVLCLLIHNYLKIKVLSPLKDWNPFIICYSVTSQKISIFQALLTFLGMLLPILVCFCSLRI
jgi:predicted MPP superfamily phosphohydrolase